MGFLPSLVSSQTFGGDYVKYAAKMDIFNVMDYSPFVEHKPCFGVDEGLKPATEHNLNSGLVLASNVQHINVHKLRSTVPCCTDPQIY